MHNLYVTHRSSQDVAQNLCRLHGVPYAQRMDSIAWLEAVTRGDSGNAIAQNARVQQPTLGRQRRAGSLSPEMIVAIARGYHVPVLPGLIACGLITEAEAELKDRLGGVEEVLASASDEQLLRAVLRRVEGGSRLDSILTCPLDETHPMLHVPTGDEIDEMPPEPGPSQPPDADPPPNRQ